MEIGGFIDKVTKLDLNTDNRARGKFARLVVYINLETPLISQVLVNGRNQRVEYEFPPTVCFQYGRYGHIKESCPFKTVDNLPGKRDPSSELTPKNMTMAINENA